VDDYVRGTESSDQREEDELVRPEASSKCDE